MVRRRPVAVAALVLAAALSVADVAAAQGASPAAVPRFPFAKVDVAATLVFGAAAILVFPDGVRDAVRRVRDAPGAALGWGVLAFVAGPLAIALAALTVVGLLVAIPAVPTFLVYVLAAGAAGKTAVGYLLVARVADPSLWLGLLTGALLTALLYSIPLVGPALNAVLWLFGVGAVSKRLYRNYRG